MSATAELAQLHELIHGLRRCVASLASRYGDSPGMRRIVNSAERIQNDIDRLNIDAEEFELSRGLHRHHHVAEKIAIPDTEYDTNFWHGIDDEGLR
ncbi:hypothetical protein [Mycolicibacterium thermoresistibile]